MFKLSATNTHDARVSGHRLLDVAGEVGLGPRRADRRSDQLPGRHLEVTNQSQRPVPRVLELDFPALPEVISLVGAIRSNA